MLSLRFLPLSLPYFCPLFVRKHSSNSAYSYGFHIHNNRIGNGLVDDVSHSILILWISAAYELLTFSCWSSVLIGAPCSHARTTNWSSVKVSSVVSSSFYRFIIVVLVISWSISRFFSSPGLNLYFIACSFNLVRKLSSSAFICLLLVCITKGRNVRF